MGRLSDNPHYKATPAQLAREEEKDVKTFGVLPKQNTMTIPKHPTKPRTKIHKTLIEK